MSSKLAIAQARIKNMRERSEEGVAQVVTTAVTVGACGAMSYANVKWGDAEGRLKVAGIDVDLGGGLVLAGLGLAGLAAKRSGRAEMTSLVLNAAGNGLLCTYIANKAAEMAAQSTSAQGVPRQMNAAGRPRGIPIVSDSILSRAAAEGRL